MEWRFELGLGAITLVVIGLVIYFGLKLDKAVMRRAPQIDFPLNLTLAGTALYACMVAFWIFCVATRELRPESSFGAFVGTTDGLIAVIAGSLFFAGVAGEILRRLGYPIAKRGGSDA